MKKLLFFSLASLCVHTCVEAQTPVFGNITSDTRWTLQRSPFLVTGDVAVYGGVTLTIDAGVLVFFEPQRKLTIAGSLIARGSQDSMIVFTSSKSTPAPGDWGGIEFLDTSVPATVDPSLNYISGAIVQYCKIAYAAGAIACRGASPYIADNVIYRNINYYGAINTNQTSAPYILRNIIINNSSSAISAGFVYNSFFSTPLIQQNLIIDNQNYGVLIDHYAHPVARWNLIRDNKMGIFFDYYENSVRSFDLSGNTLTNREYEVYLQNNISSPGWELTIGSNWFGSSSGNDIAMKIYDYYDKITEAKLIFTPFLTAPDPTVPALQLLGPTVTFDSNTVAYEDSQYRASFMATDPYGYNLTYSVLKKPSWLSFSPNPPTLSGTPRGSNLGLDSIVISVSNPYATSHLRFLLAVIHVNFAPNAFHLRLPANRDTVRLRIPPASLKFAWRKSSDSNVGDTLQYSLRLNGPAIDTTLAGLRDTVVELSIMPRLLPSSVYTWSARVTDGVFNVASIDTFTFRTSSTITGVGDLPNFSANEDHLFQNYPNPLNPSTTIRFLVAHPGPVILKVFDLLGQEVALLVSKTFTPGAYSVEWKPCNLTSGVYLYRLESGSFVQAKKLILLK